MRKGVLVVVTVGATVATMGAGALAWHLSEPWRERSSFVNKCLANKFTEATCTCTYSAYKDLVSPYDRLVKSAVHADMTTFAKTATVTFGRKTAQVGLGLDPTNLISNLGELKDKTIGKVLRETGQFFMRHKFKAAGTAIAGVTATKALIVYRTGRFGIEIGQAAITVERHCGIVTASIPSTWEQVKGAAAKSWDVTRDAADASWQGTKTVAGSAWNGTKQVADKTWEGTKGAASWTFDKLRGAGRLVGIGRDTE